MQSSTPAGTILLVIHQARFLKKSESLATLKSNPRSCYAKITSIQPTFPNHASNRSNHFSRRAMSTGSTSSLQTKELNGKTSPKSISAASTRSPLAIWTTPSVSTRSRSASTRLVFISLTWVTSFNLGLKSTKKPFYARPQSTWSTRYYPCCLAFSASGYAL